MRLFAFLGVYGRTLGLRFLVSTLSCAIFLAACGTRPPSSKPEGGKPPQGSPEPPGATSTPPVPNPKSPEPPKGPACPVDKAQSQDLAHSAANLLYEGREPEAKAELVKALCMDRSNPLAESLMRQITANPVVYFAEKYGGKSSKYTVKSGDTLSKIAAAYLGDPYQFYILARYNGISVPKSVHAQQVIQVPGNASPPVPSPPVSPGPQPTTPLSPQAERLYQAGQQALIVSERDKAYDLFMQSAKLDPKDPRARAEADKLKPELIALHERKAREAYARQDLDAAIMEWGRVLDLDPNNATALRERQRALDLQKITKDLPDTIDLPNKPKPTPAVEVEKEISLWPLPRPSAMTVIEPVFIEAKGVPRNLGELNDRLERAMSEAGYVERSYYDIPDGFALAAQLEQINDDGTPKPIPDRWSLSYSIHFFSLGEIIKQLFTAPPGHWRVLVFVVTPRSLLFQPEPMTEKKAQDLARGGYTVLPQHVGRKPYTTAPDQPTIRVSALIYEFEKRRYEVKGRFVKPSPLDAREHLRKANLWQALFQ